jgi:hypothetical protein
MTHKKALQKFTNNQMKTIIFFGAVIVIASLYISNITITFKPFSVSFEKPINGIGFFLFALGMAIMMSGHHIYGYREGFKKSNEETMQIIKELNNEKNR